MKHVTALDAYSNNITEAGIGHIIKGKWKLKELHIAENNLKNGGFLKVINNRYFLNNLIILDVGFNDIEIDECNINILLNENLPKMQILYLDGNTTTTEAAQNILNALKNGKFPSLKELKIDLDHDEENFEELVEINQLIQGFLAKKALIN